MAAMHRRGARHQDVVCGVDGDGWGGILGEEGQECYKREKKGAENHGEWGGRAGEGGAGVQAKIRILKRDEILPFHFFRDKIDPTS